MVDEVVEKKEKKKTATKKAEVDKPKKKSLNEQIAEIKEQESKIFSEKEYKRQCKKEKAMHSTLILIIFAVVFGIVGLVRGVKMYNAGGRPSLVITQPLLFAAIGGIVIGGIVKGISMIFIKRGFEKEKLARYKVLEAKIEKLEVDKKENAARGKRKNKLFICSIRRGIQAFDSYKMHLRIGNYDLGEFYGVQAIELDPGQYTLTGNFFFIYERNGSVYTKSQELKPITVNVGSGGSFVFLDVCIPVDGYGSYTHSFKELTSRQFNEQAQKYGIKEYY